MTDYTPIEPGDVFAKQWGQREIVLMIVPNKRSTNRKLTYARLHRDPVTFETTWSRTRASFCYSWRHIDTMRYIGTVPVDWIHDVLIGRSNPDNSLF